MRHYELVTILSPMLSPDQANEAWGQITDFITNRNGEIIQELPWGTRRLAYPIQRGSHHFLEGNYRLTRFSTERPFNQALETSLRLDERVLRYLIVAIPEGVPIPEPAPPVQPARPAPPPAAETAAAEGDAPAPETGETTETPAVEGEAVPVAVEPEASDALVEAVAEAPTMAAPAVEAEPATDTTPAEEPAASVETELAAEVPAEEIAADAAETPAAPESDQPQG